MMPQSASSPVHKLVVDRHNGDRPLLSLPLEFYQLLRIDNKPTISQDPSLAARNGELSCPIFLRKLCSPFLRPTEIELYLYALRQRPGEAEFLQHRLQRLDQPLLHIAISQ